MLVVHCDNKINDMYNCLNAKFFEWGFHYDCKSHMFRDDRLLWIGPDHPLFSPFVSSDRLSAYFHKQTNKQTNGRDDGAVGIV